MTFTTQSSIGSHYRLLDPSWESELKDKEQTTEEELEKNMALNASRTYVFDINKDKNRNGMKMGVRLFDLGEGPTKWMEKFKEEGLLSGWTENDLEKLWNGKVVIVNNYGGGTTFAIDRTDIQKYNTGHETAFASNFLKKSRSATVNEASYIMQGKEITSGVTTDRKKRLTSHDSSDIQDFLNRNNISGEVNVSFREDKGSTFHLTNMDLKAGHSYMLILSADAYEIENGRRVWCSYYSEKDRKPYNIHWQQNKAWFFRIKGEEEEKIVTDSLRNLEPYVALAYPSYNGTRVRDERGEGETKAYFNDIMHPTIALNRDIRTYLPTSKMQWVLEGYTTSGDTLRQTRTATYRTSLGGNCINLEPTTSFTPFAEFTTAASGKSNYDFNQEHYRLRLLYTYNHKAKEIDWEKTTARVGWSEYIYKDVAKGDSTFALVDISMTTLPHDVSVYGKKYTDSWREVTNDNNKELLAYAKPFVGACMDSIPRVLYEDDYTTKKPTDEDIVFKNAKYETADEPYRLIDPYLYLAYLGKWVFIGDREISEYAFDDVPVKFGSESLIFNYNGTVVNSEFLKVDAKKGERNKSLLELRDQMYGVWNTWNYNDPDHPKYPLPSISSTVGGITANNQDGKTSTVTPINVRNSNYTSYNFAFEDLMKDYVAAYDVAEDLCNKLRTSGREVLGHFYTQMAKYDGDCNSPSFDDGLNAALKKWNSLHRGQYLEASQRGYTVRLPYYQLPLIFGGCFGSDDVASTYAAPTMNAQRLNKDYRTLGASIGSNDLSSGDGDPANARLSMRWDTRASNLFFFRLTGSNSNTTHVVGSRSYKDYVFSTYTDKYTENYPTNSHVNWDNFQRSKALEAVTRFKARIYRVDAYDIQKGQYVVTSATSGRGGGPWEQTVNVCEGNGVKNLGDMYSQVEAQDEFRETHYETEIPQVLWLEDTKTLVFQCTSKILSVGSSYVPHVGNKALGTVSRVWIRDDVKDGKWRLSTIKDNCVKIYVHQQFVLAPNEVTQNLKSFFQDFKSVKEVTGLRFLSGVNTTDMSYLFAGCKNLETVDCKDWQYTQNVTSMSHMFDGCVKLR